jgi:methyl-accepting chemotaxis protein
MAEESTAATHALAQESDELVRLVSQFRLGKDGAAGHAAKIAPVRAARSGATGRAAPSAARPQPNLRTAGQRGASAVRKVESAADEEGWEEF